MKQETGKVVGSDAWRAAYPGVSLGVLVMGGVSNPAASPDLEILKAALETELRSRFASQDRSHLKSHATLSAYAAYYKRFDKTYHVQHQLESLVFKGRPIPRVAALIEAMFMAELKNLLLTAGHDLDRVQGAVRLDVADGTESYVMLNGQEQALKRGDMLIGDDAGILSCILYGPDQRTRITPATTNALFTVYAPAGIGQDSVDVHLDDLSRYVRAVAPGAQVEHREVLLAGVG